MKRNIAMILMGLAVGFLGTSGAALSSQTQPPAAITPITELSGHTGWVTALAWSPDGSILASSSGDYTADDHSVRLWGRDGSVLAVVDNRDRTYSVAWSPDGTLLAAGTENGSITLLDARGKRVRKFLGAKGVVYRLAWSPDGLTLAAGVSGGPSTNRVQLWNREGRLLKTLPTKYSGGKFYNVAWSPDGRFLAAGAIDYNLWTADGTVVFTHDKCERCTPAWGLTWSPDSRMWAVGDENSTVYVYSVEGELVARLQSGISVDALDWSPDGAILAGGNSLWHWNGETFQHQGGAFNGRSAVAWSPDGELLAAAFVGSSQVRVVNRQNELAALLEFQAIRLSWSPDGQILAAGSGDTMIRLWDRTAAAP